MDGLRRSASTVRSDSNMKDTDDPWPTPSGPSLEQVRETIASLETVEATSPSSHTKRRPKEPRGGGRVAVPAKSAGDLLSTESEAPLDGSAVDVQSASTATASTGPSRVAWVAAAAGFVLLLWAADLVRVPAVLRRSAEGTAPVRAVPPRQRFESPRAEADSGTQRLESSAATAERPSPQVDLGSARVEPPAARVEPPAARVEPPAARVEPPAARVESPAARVEPPAARVEPPAARVEPPAARVEPSAARVETAGAAVALKPPSTAPESLIQSGGAFADRSTPSPKRRVARVCASRR